MRRSYDESEALRHRGNLVPENDLFAAIIEENQKPGVEREGNPSALAVTPSLGPVPSRAPESTGSLSPISQRWASLTELEREAQRDRWREQLRPHVVQLAEIAAGDGITASDVLSRGITAGILNGERSFQSAHPKVYAWIGHLLLKMSHEGELSVKKHAGMVVRRRSERLTSKGNLGVVYVAARFALESAA